MSMTNFLQQIKKVHEACSITRTAAYDDFEVDGSMLSFRRVNTDKTWNIYVNRLFEAYKQHNFITPTILRKSMTGRIYSPAWAVLVEAGFYNRYGKKI